MTQDTMAPENTTLRRDCDVVVVGAGIVGLYTALLLKKEGINVQIYERQPGMYPLPKAMSLSDEMVRAFHLHGFSDLVKSQVINAGVLSDNPYFRWTDADHNILSKFRNRDPGSSGYSAMSVFHQPNFEAYFNLQCEANQIPLYRRWIFTESSESEDGTLNVHFRRNTNGLRDIYNHRVDVRCKWLIGCDGANSAVRQHAGLKQQDLQFQYDWLVVDLVSEKVESLVCQVSSSSPTQLPNPDLPRSITWTQVCDPRRPTTVIGEGINGRRRLEFMRLEDETIEELCSYESTWKLLKPYHMTPSNTEIERAAVYKFQALNTLEYWDGKRTLIAGDAAHLSPPFIGQGLNSGFRDAIGLSWRLARILKGKSAPAIMQSYSLERRVHTQHLIDIATGHGDLICELNKKRARELHAAMRDKYIAGGEKEEPFLESVLHPDGCLLADRDGGRIFINRPVLSLGPSSKQGSRLCDDVVVVTSGWRIFCLSSHLNFPSQAQIGEAVNLLSFIDAAFITLTDSQDVHGHYRFFFSDHWNLALVRPDQYTFAFFKDFDDLYSQVPLIKARVFDT